MPSYPLSTLACTISATGITAPSYDDIYLSLCASYQGIYGSDVNLDPDTQDGQWIAIIAQAQNDNNAITIATYNSFSPASAQGTGLSSVVKINGLARNIPTNSTVALTITGTPGRIITGGAAADGFGNIWNLPASVTIGSGGSSVVTGTAAVVGAIAAAPATITTIQTPTLGWISVSNVAAASAGAPVESDAALRARQAISTAIASATPVDAMIAAVSNITGVTRIAYDENTSNTTDANGVPSHSIGLVVEGGSAATIAATIKLKKTGGTGTYGSISQIVLDAYGVPENISFSAPTYIRITVNIAVKALAGYSSIIGADIVAAVHAYINALPIGAPVYLTQVITAAITGSTSPSTFNLIALTMGEYPATPTAADITMSYAQAAALALSDISLTVS